MALAGKPNHPHPHRVDGLKQSQMLQEAILVFARPGSGYDSAIAASNAIGVFNQVPYHSANDPVVERRRMHIQR